MICFSFYGLGVNCFSCITRISLLGDEINDKSLIVFDLIFESEARWSLIGEGMAVTEHAMGLGTEGQKILIASPCISSILGLAYAPSIPGHMSVNFLFSSLVSHFGQHPAYCAQPILQDHKCLGCADLLALFGFPYLPLYTGHSHHSGCLLYICH